MPSPLNSHLVACASLPQRPGGGHSGGLRTDAASPSSATTPSALGSTAARAGGSPDSPLTPFTVTQPRTYGLTPAPLQHSASGPTPRAWRGLASAARVPCETAEAGIQTEPFSQVAETFTAADQDAGLGRIELPAATAPAIGRQGDGRLSRPGEEAQAKVEGGALLFGAFGVGVRPGGPPDLHAAEEGHGADEGADEGGLGDARFQRMALAELSVSFEQAGEESLN